MWCSQLGLRGAASAQVISRPWSCTVHDFVARLLSFVLCAAAFQDHLKGLSHEPSTMTFNGRYETLRSHQPYVRWLACAKKVLWAQPCRRKLRLRPLLRRKFAACLQCSHHFERPCHSAACELPCRLIAGSWLTCRRSYDALPRHLLLEHSAVMFYFLLLQGQLACSGSKGGWGHLDPQLP